LPAPIRAAQAHETFKARASNVLGSENGSTLTLASTKEELLNQIEEAKTGIPRRLSALENFRRASFAHHAYVEEREKGAKRVGRLAQEKANKFAQFVAAYSGITELVKTAGEPYALIAFQTLSILVIVSLARSDQSAWLALC
jgi:hypothetical protein